MRLLSTLLCWLLLAFQAVITNAHRVNEGQMPEIPAKGRESDFFFIDRSEPDQIAATLVEMVKTRIPARFRFDAIRDTQVLCPMNRGSLGMASVNGLSPGVPTCPKRPNRSGCSRAGLPVSPASTFYSNPPRREKKRGCAGP